MGVGGGRGASCYNFFGGWCTEMCLKGVTIILKWGE